jgi:hypothetical protein
VNDWNIAEILLEMRRRSRFAYKSEHYFLTLDGTFSRNSLYKCDKVAALFNQKLRLFALLNPKSKTIVSSQHLASQGRVQTETVVLAIFKFHSVFKA